MVFQVNLYANDTNKLYPFKDISKYGYMDKFGNVKINPSFDFAYEFSEGYAGVLIGINIYYINLDGEIIFELGNYSEAPIPNFPTFNDNIIITTKDGLFGYMDNTGKIISEPVYLEATSFKDGLACVIKDNKSYIIDRNGKIKTQLDDDIEIIGNFYDDLALYKSKSSGKYGYIDKAGNIVIKALYSDAFNFSEGLACVSIDNSVIYGFINNKGDFVIQARSEAPFSFSEGLCIFIENNKYGFLDKTGNVVIPAKYDEVLGFSDGLASVRINDKWGFIDKKGEIVIEPKYMQVYFFENDIASVYDSDNTFYINKNGDIISPKLNNQNENSDYDYISLNVKYDSLIQGISCKAGTTVTFNYGGDLVSATLSKDAIVKEMPCKGGTEVSFGLSCHFTLSKDFKIGDIVFKENTEYWEAEGCYGGILANDQDIYGFPCKGNTELTINTGSVTIYLTLSKDFEINGEKHKAGDTISAVYEDLN